MTELPHATEIISGALDVRRSQAIEAVLREIVETGGVSEKLYAQARRALARYDNDYMVRGRLLDSACDILVRGHQIAADWLARHPEGPHVYRDTLGREHDCNCRPYIEAYRTFLADHVVTPCMPLHGPLMNRILLHVRLNHDVLGYTTEPDQVLFVDSMDFPVVMDLKTGSVPAGGDLHPWGLQTAAQKDALLANGVQVGLRMVLNLREDGTYRLFREHQDRDIFTIRDAGAFRVLVQARHIRGALGERRPWSGIKFNRSSKSAAS